MPTSRQRSEYEEKVSVFDFKATTTLCFIGFCDYILIPLDSSKTNETNMGWHFTMMIVKAAPTTSAKKKLNRQFTNQIKQK